MDESKSVKCANCKKRPGTQKWVGDGGYLALSHGFYSMWCEICVLKEQIDHAQERAAAIPEMIERLADLVLKADQAEDPNHLHQGV